MFKVLVWIISSFNGPISYLETAILFAYFFRFVYKIRCIMKMADILMLNQSNSKNNPSFSEFSEQSWNNNFAMVDPVGSTGCDTAANVHQQLAQHCYCWSGYNTASSTSIQYIAKVGKKAYEYGSFWGNNTKTLSFR